MTRSDASSEPPRGDFLAGLRVLELGDGVAGSAASSVLWSLGADVTAVVDPSSPHRHGRPALQRGGRAVSLLPVVLDRGKELVTAADSAQLDDLLAGGFDVVVVDRVGGGRGALAVLEDADAYVAFVRARNRSAWVTISAFGLTGGRADDIASELTVAAASGMLASVHDPRTERPLKLAGHQSMLNTGQVAALAACHGVDLAADGPVHLDLSAVEATIASGPVLELACHSFDTGSRGGASRYGAPAGFYACRDGLIRISAMEDHQWEGVVRAMGSPAWTSEFASMQARIDAARVVDEGVSKWAATTTKLDAEASLQANGVPATAMRSPAEILDSAQLAHRGSIGTVPVEGLDARVVGVPFRVVDGGNGPAGRGGRRRRGLRGLRILEAGQVLAAPLAGGILGALGADVTKLEDARRMDMYRRRGPYIDGQEGIERSAYFALVNHSKRNVVFDVDGERDRLEAILGESDVVLENLGEKRARSLGLAAASAVAEHPDLLAVSSSGFGQDGPFAAYRAYAYNLQAFGLLGHLTRNEEGESAEIDLAWADLVSGYTLATIIAAWAVGPAGNRGAGVDFAMADLIVSHFNEYVAAASLGVETDDEADVANELAPLAPHGVYPALDGWVALAIDDDERFDRLAKELAAEALTGPDFATAGARWEARERLDALVAGATRTRRAAELAAELRVAGIPAEEVVAVPDLLDVPQLRERGFFTQVTHPVWGTRRGVGIPWRVHGEPAIPLGTPPQFVPEGVT